MHGDFTGETFQKTFYQENDSRNSSLIKAFLIENLHENRRFAIIFD